MHSKDFQLGDPVARVLNDLVRELRKRKGHIAAREEQLVNELRPDEWRQKQTIVNQADGSMDALQWAIELIYRQMNTINTELIDALEARTELAEDLERAAQTWAEGGC